MSDFKKRMKVNSETMEMLSEVEQEYQKQRKKARTSR